MKIDIGFIKAETHTPEYLMHKYWARKPHNVINECLKTLLPKDGVLLDPFCGSGVTLREGCLLGADCIGFDINPVAVLITNILISPPTVHDFRWAFDEIYEKVYKKYGWLYKTEDDIEIKYVSHRIVARCDCGNLVNQKSTIKQGKKLICPYCGKQIHYNLESLADTEVFDVTVEGKKPLQTIEKEIVRQAELSNYSDDSHYTDCFDFEFPENRRILAFRGIKTSNFFTNRNFLILSAFADEIWQLPDDSIRKCCLLLLTASAAQCSRLIAHRNNLSTGGPAWSVPGFWVPQEHLETNPFVHIRARLKKIEKGLATLNSKPSKGKATVYKGDSLELLNTQPHSNLFADVIFLDPPYGDSVPYTEFSNIWNSFLKEIPNSDKDISVSDRIDKNQSWDIYQDKLLKYMECLTEHLKPSGKLLITFNNNDLRAWKSLIGALQKNGFVCRKVFYQIPAVISSKAQMSIDSSYISDIYSVYTLDKESLPKRDLSNILTKLSIIASARGGMISKTTLNREFIINWLKDNIDVELLDSKDEIISGLFDFNRETNQYMLKSNYVVQTDDLQVLIEETVDDLLKTGPIDLMDAYIQTAKECDKYGTIEYSEFKLGLSNYLIVDNKIIGKTTE